MKKVDYNIEYGHIFTDEKGLRFLQRKSIEILKDIIKKLEKEKKTCSTCILIDDYQPDYSYLDVGNYILEVGSIMPPDYMAYESKMTKAVEELFKAVPKREEIVTKEPSKLETTKNVTFLSKDKEKIALKEESLIKYEEVYRTPLLIACWHLMRLGLLKSQGVKETKIGKKVPFPGKKTVTIIPKKYKKIDEQAIKIISYTKFNKYIDNIEHVYF